MERSFGRLSKKRRAMAFYKAIPPLSCAFALCFFSAFGRCADEQPPPERLLHFPKDYSAGTLDIEGEPWREFADARGEVTIPAGKGVRLQVSQECIDKGLTALETLRPDDLDYLWFDRRHGLSDSLFSRFQRLTGLRGITFIRCTGFQGNGFEHLKSLPSLHSLSLGNLELTDEAVPYLIHLRRLRRLSLRGTEISFEGYKRIRQSLPEIRDFDPPKNYDELDFSITLKVTDTTGTVIPKANVTVIHYDFDGFRISVGSQAKSDKSPQFTGQTDSRGETKIYFHNYASPGHRGWQVAFLVEAAGYQPTAFVFDRYNSPWAVALSRLRRDGCPVEGRVENIPTSWTQPLVVIAAPSLPMDRGVRGLFSPYEWAVAKADVGRGGGFKFPPLPPGDYQLNVLAAATAQWPWGSGDTQVHLLRNEEDREKAAHQETPRYFGNLGQAKLTLPLEGLYPGPVTLKIKEDVAAIYVKDEKDRPVVDARLGIEWFKDLVLSYYPSADGSIYYSLFDPLEISRKQPWSVTVYYDKIAGKYTRQTRLFASWWGSGVPEADGVYDPDKHHFDFQEKDRREPIRVKRE